MIEGMEKNDEDEKFQMCTLCANDVWSVRPDLTLEQAQELLTRMMRKWEIDWPDAVASFACNMYGPKKRKKGSR